MPPSQGGGREFESRQGYKGKVMWKKVGEFVGDCFEAVAEFVINLICAIFD